VQIYENTLTPQISFFKKLHKRVVEQILKAKLDTHLDTEEHQITKDGNYHNRHILKKIRISYEEKEIKVSRNREEKVRVICFLMSQLSLFLKLQKPL